MVLLNERMLSLNAERGHPESDNDCCNQLCVASNMYICTLVIPTRPHTRTHLRSAEGSLVCPWFRRRDLVDANLVFGGRTAFISSGKALRRHFFCHNRAGILARIT